MLFDHNFVFVLVLEGQFEVVRLIMNLLGKLVRFMELLGLMWIYFCNDSSVSSREGVGNRRGRVYSCGSQNSD